VIAPALPPGWRLRVEESLPSTQDLVLRLASAGEAEGLAVLARRQTAGRGREGRAWDSPSGNLHLTLLLRPGGPARHAPQWALLSAVVLAEALGSFLPDPTAIRLKWPNDLLLGEAKLAGVLCESAADMAGGIEWLVIGLGANLAMAPPVQGRAVACLAELAPPPAPEAVAARILHAVEAWRGRGFAAVRDAWMARGPASGQPITLRAGAGSVQGLYAGLAPDGSLMLDTGTGPRAFSSGEIPAGGR
jgi:BirA family biotin operon repressor/biotin-[acetyl-CoA-carboxylase] ligase